MQQPKFTVPIKFQKFSKYDFVKSYSANAKNDEVRKEKEQEAAIIADAIEETQAVLLENLATKEDLKVLEYKLMIKGGIFMTVLITFAPKLWKFLEMGGF